MVFISDYTEYEYIEDLRERRYDFYLSGKKNLDSSAVLDDLSRKYEVQTLLTDTGRILGNLLLAQGLVSEISLLFHPVIVGEDGYGMFDDLKNVGIELIDSGALEDCYVWTRYRVLN